MPAPAPAPAPVSAPSNALPWVAPFAVFMIWLAVGPSLGLPQPWESIARVAVLAAVLLTVSRDVVFALRVQHPLMSIALGVAVCALWVAPDQLVPGWRSHWLFTNSITGKVTNSIPPEEFANLLVVTLRVVRAALLVPILEELFWRGWLPRWLINNDFAQVPLGTFNTMGFVGTAVLFASEHGPFWEVGLLCGLIYNAYMWKTKSLGDLMLVHGVTNLALSGFVLVTKQYAYWM
jgi:CAAX prenyl protease-like protein